MINRAWNSAINGYPPDVTCRSDPFFKEDFKRYENLPYSIKKF